MTLKHLLLPLALVLPVVASAQSISQAQIEQFSQLPEAQQKALARQYGIDLSSLKQDNPVGKRPKTVNVVDPVDEREGGKTSRSPDQPAEKGNQSHDSDELKPYGYDLFAGSPTTFAPVTEIPVPARYTLGPGDVLNIQLWGKENQSLQLPVSRDGTISFPQSGPMSVAGLTFDEVRQQIRKRVSEQYIGVEASVSLGELRSMRVFVLGEARNPGSYTVSSLSTMTNTLYVAGGIKKSGSLRRVQHKRDGKVVGTLDLYQLLLHGDNSGDDRLQPGDVIFIPPVGQRAGIEGEVNRPALYELKGKTSIADLIALAGGLTSQAYPGRINIERTNKDFLRIIAEADFTRPEGRAAPVQAGDLIHVPSIADVTGQYVEVKGAATHTGKFAWVPGMRVSSLIRNLDSDLLPIADKNYAAIVRTDPANDTISVLNLRLRKALANPGGPEDLTLSEKDRLLFFSDGGKVDVASEGSDKANVTPGSSDESQENSLPAYTRSVLFEPVLQRLKAQASPGQPQQIISISGPVRYPGDYPMPATHRLADALFIAGGLKDSASLMRAEVARHTTDESGVEKTTILTVGLADAMAGDSDLVLRSRDRILIKSIPDFAKTRTVDLKGEVRYPGVYTFRDGETLKDVLARAGGLTENAFPKGAVFTREKLRQREAQRLREAEQRLKGDLLGVQLRGKDFGNQGQNAQQAQDLLEEVQSSRPVGRMVINLPAIVDGKAEMPIRLQDGDTLTVPSIPQSVSVFGEVQFPTSHLYQPGLTVDDYLERSGGPTRQADPSRVYVVKADGSVLLPERSHWFGGSSQRLAPGDTIIMPIDVDRLNQLELWTNVSQIVYQMALGAAAVGNL